MSIDAYILLRIRDQVAFREALEAHYAAMRAEWLANGGDGEYDADADALHVDNLEDGSVAIATRLRFTDRDVDFAIRWWLDEHFGERLKDVHDDPRGVFVYPDICEPTSRTYADILKELASAGHFIDPSPPTAEEHETRRRDMDAYVDGMRAVQAAAKSADELALGRALAAAPQEVRDVWEEQEHMLRRVAEMMTEHAEKGPALAPAGGVVIDFKLAAERIRKKGL